MPSFNIHLAVARVYVQKNSNYIKNLEEFYDGILAPDLVKDKLKTHYTAQRDERNLEDFLRKKVQLNEYLKQNEINSDFDKGVFLHLVTDYIFFTEFFDKEFLNNTNYDEFINNLYYSYDLSNEYLYNKYSLYLLNLEKINEKLEKDIKKNEKLNNIRKEEKHDNILSFQKLDKFIDYVSNIDLEEYKNNILKCL